MSRFRLHLIVAFLSFVSCASMDDVFAVRREGNSALRAAVVGSPGGVTLIKPPEQMTLDDTMSDAESDAEDVFVRRDRKRKIATQGVDDMPNTVAHSPLSAGIRRSVQQRSSSKSVDTLEMDGDMIEVRHQSDTRRDAWRLSSNSTSRLVAKDNCLKLSKDGFPLAVPDLLRQFPTKVKFFNHLSAIGYDKDLHVEARGRARVYENTCLAKPGSNSHVIFIGDCMERMSFNAYVRNRRDGEQANGTDPHLIILSQPETAELYKVGEGLPMWTDHDATYVRWFGGDEDAFLFFIRKVFLYHKLNASEDSVVIWFGNGIHPFFREVVGSKFPVDLAWTKPPDREAKLRSFVSRVKSEFPGARLAWGTTGYIDVPLMEAKPPYPSVEAFPVIAPKISEANRLDERVMRSLGVPVVPRADISAAYRGIQCDGLHSDPHDATGADAWNCPGFPALESLVLQAGLAELCGGNALESICAPS